MNGHLVLSILQSGSGVPQLVSDQYSEDYLSWVQILSQASCSFSACGICLQGWVICNDIALAADMV